MKKRKVRVPTLSAVILVVCASALVALNHVARRRVVWGLEAALSAGDLGRIGEAVDALLRRGGEVQVVETTGARYRGLCRGSGSIVYDPSRDVICGIPGGGISLPLIVEAVARRFRGGRIDALPGVVAAQANGDDFVRAVAHAAAVQLVLQDVGQGVKMLASIADSAGPSSRLAIVSVLRSVVWSDCGAVPDAIALLSTLRDDGNPRVARCAAWVLEDAMAVAAGAGSLREPTRPAK